MSLNEQQGRLKVSVDPDLQPLVPAFLQHRRQETKLLLDAFERSDYVTIQKLAHSIKGVGGGYGFNGLSEIGACLEGAAKRRNSPDVQNGLSDLIDYLGRVDVVYECVSERPLIVCVDDESSMLEILERTLTKSGFRVMGSLGGAKAISLIHETKPALILMDIKMPGMSGYEICACLHESADVAKIPVMFVTGMNGENDRAEAFAAGASDFLLKPFDLAVLVQKTRKTLQAVPS